MTIDEAIKQFKEDAECNRVDKLAKEFKEQINERM